MLVLHLVEILIWAAVLLHLGLAPRIQNAIYFCDNAYTTLGMGSLDLGEHWRTISPIIAISGLFTFAWTTSSLVDVVSTHTRLLEQLELQCERQLKLRMAAGEEAWKTVDEVRMAEQKVRAEARCTAAVSGFFGRFKVGKGKQMLTELRAEAKEEIAEIRRRERSDEKKLEQGGPNDHAGS